MTSFPAQYRIARQNGRLKPKPCEVCGSVPSEGHHDDYRKPLKVKWLCRKHHRRVHESLKKSGKKIPGRDSMYKGSLVMFRLSNEEMRIFRRIADQDRRSLGRLASVVVRDWITGKLYVPGKLTK